jgi:hypothetical protein
MMSRHLITLPALLLLFGSTADAQWTDADDNETPPAAQTEEATPEEPESEDPPPEEPESEDPPPMQREQPVTDEEPPAEGESPKAPVEHREMYVGLALGPGFNIEPSGGGVRFWFGPEFGMKYFEIPVLLAFKDSVKYIDVVPKFKMDFELIDNLIVAPVAGLAAGFALSDTLNAIEVGIEIGARAIYLLMPNVGVFLEPIGLNLSFFQYYMHKDADNDAEADLHARYRILFGGHYRF